MRPAQNITTADNGHHKYSPSKLKLLKQCPGYAGDDEPSEAAAEGTLLHAAAETGDTAGLTDEQRGLVAMVTDYRDAVLFDCREVMLEKRLEICGGLLFGTADVVAVNGPAAHVIDYKFGRVSVDPAESNLQGWAYALGVFAMTGAETVTVHFLSPRRDEVSRAVYTEADIPSLEAAIRGVVALAEAFEADGRPADRLSPSPAVCRWCARRGECPALTTPCTDLATRANGGLTLPAETNPGLMTADQLHVALQAAPIVEAWTERWIKACRGEAMRRLKDGDPTLSARWQIKRRAGKREVANAVAASQILATQFGADEVDIAACTSFVMGDAEKVVAARAGRGKGTAAKEALSDALEAAGLLSRRPDYEFVCELE